MRDIPVQIFTMGSLDTVEINDNLITGWTDEDLDYGQGSMKTLNIVNNTKLGQPPVALLKDSNINKLLLAGCDVLKKEMLNGMEKNGVFEYQERHKKKLNQAVDNRLDVDYKIFGLE